MARVGLVTSSFAMSLLVACTLLKPSEDELRGNRGGSGGGGTSGGGSGGSGLGGSWPDSGDAPCASPAQWSTVSLAGGAVGSPLLVQRKALNDFVLAWVENGNARLRNITSDLSAGTPQDITTAGNVNHLRVAFNESDAKLGLVWFDTTLQFASVDQNGNVNAHPVYSTDPLAPDGKAPTSAVIAPRSGGWGIVWQGNGDSAARLYALITDIDGNNVTGGEGYTRLTDPPSCNDKLHPALVAKGTAFAVAYADNDNDGSCPSNWSPDIRIQSPDENLGPGASSLVEPVAGFSDFPALAYDGSDFGVAWIDERAGGKRVWFARVGAATAANQLSDDEPSDGKAPSIAAGNDGFGVAWQSASKLEFGTIKDGVKQYHVTVAEDANAGETPSVIWDGKRWLIAWSNSTAQISSCSPSP